MSSRLALLGAVLAFAAGPAAAQLPSAAVVDSLDAYYVDFSVPDLAAFTLLGVDVSRVSRPGNVRETALALVNGLNASGEAEAGVGVEVALARVLAAPQVRADYDGLRDRFTVSFATDRQDDAARVALGVRWVPVDKADPYEDAGLRRAVGRALDDALADRPTATETAAFANALVEALQALGAADDALALDRDSLRDVRRTFSAERDALRALDRVPPPDTARASLRRRIAAAAGVPPSRVRLTPALDALAVRYAALAALANEVDSRARLDARVVAAKDSFRAATWNAFSLQVAAGVTATVPTLGDARAEAVRAFGGVSLPLGRRGQLVGHGQIALPLDGETADDVAPGGEVQASVGGRLLWGTATQRFAVEALWGTNDPRLDGEDHLRLTVGAEVRVDDGVYLELVTGLDDLGDGARLLSLGGLRYAFRKDRRFPSP